MINKITASLLVLILIGISGLLATPQVTGEQQFGSDLQVEPGKNMNVSEASSAYFQCESDNGFTGISLTYAGDLNGDGIDDMAIPASGSSENGPYAGKVYIVFGSYNGFSGYINLSTAGASYLGETTYDSVGYTLAGLGDINGDGFDDLAIGSVGNDEGGASAGKVYLIFGKASGWERNVNLSTVESTIKGTESVFYLSTSMSTAGDVNGDGLSDFILGSFKQKAFLFMGTTNMSRWNTQMIAADADTVFNGETSYDGTGDGVAGGGDLNGDGLSDIIVSSTKNSDAASYAGKVHVFFGRQSGFDSEVSVSTSDASFLGEGPMNMTGRVAKCNGDVNSDGFDDILVSTHSYSVGGSYRGKTYLILGKVSGWQQDVPLSNSDASWIGESSTDYSGSSLSIIGDQNSDGYDDIMIGAYFADLGEQMNGKAYIIRGRASGWQQNISLAQEPISLLGESYMDYLGKAVSGAGDVDGDGFIDVLVSAQYNDENGENRGKVYLINSMKSYDPESVYSVMFYDDPFYTNVPEYADRGGMLYLQLKGKDGNSTNTDSTTVNVTFEWNNGLSIPIGLRETGMDTGIYRGRLAVPMNAEYKMNITAISTVDPSKSAKVMAHTPILMMPLDDFSDAKEGEDYLARYWNFGYETNLDWKLITNANWLFFYPSTGEIKGTPANEHVGKYDVRIDLSDGKGNSDFREFELKVENRDPVIETQDITIIAQDEFYYVDYDSNEDDSNMVTWHYLSQASWLTLNPDTGELFGTPTNDDTGEYFISVWVDDGNDGMDSSDFTLNVTNINDPPTIVTEDVTELDQGDNFRRDYDVEDIDWKDSHTWTMMTDAAWLTMDERSGVLSGIPGPLDIGVFNVIITVSDQKGLTDSHEFKLVVNNVNDRPELTDIPYNMDIEHGETYTFDVNGSDIDGYEGLTFTLTTSPDTDMKIDPLTGVIQWEASIDWFIGNSKRLRVKIVLTDGEFQDKHEFDLNVIPSTPPISSLETPDDGVKISKDLAILSWSGYDVEGDDLTYDIYIGETKAFVESLKEETIYLNEYSGTETGLEGLETGKTYFWIVIPHDGCSYGTSSTGVKSFTLNYPPQVEVMGMQEIEAGKTFKLLLNGEDEDDDRRDLKYELIDGPEGLTIDEKSGLIKWEPGRKDIMLHQATISITDGIDTTTLDVNIDVVEPTGDTVSGSSAMIFVIGGAIGSIILIGGIIGVTLYSKKKRAMGEEEEEKVTLETAFENDEPEETVEPASSKYSSVLISATEAHQRDKVQHKVTYESLYGQTKPKTDEKGMTTKELKEFIGEKITELEKIE